VIGVRARRIVALASATLVLLGVGSLSARGAESSLFGYAMSATGSAISTLYNQPTFGVPSDPTFELRKIYSLAELDSGPSSHGLGSVLWPGQVVGNAPPSLAADVLIFNPTQFAALTETCAPKQVQPLIPQSLPSPLPSQLPPPIPSPPQCSTGTGPAIGIDPSKQALSEATAGRSGYPIRAEAFYPSDKTDDSQPLGAASQEALARQDIADASSSSGGGGVKGAISFGSIYSRSVSQVVKGVAVATSVTQITDLDMFGAIHIDSLLATATTTSDGAKGTADGSFEIAGMTIKDQNGAPQFRIALDKSGFRIQTYDKSGKPQDRFTQDPIGKLTNELINKYLGPQGISLLVGTPIDTVNGPYAKRTLAGLTLHLNAKKMTKLLDAIDKAAPCLGGVGPVPCISIKSTLKNPTSNHTISDPLFGDGGPLNPLIHQGLLSPTVAGLIASFFQGDQTMDFVFGGIVVSSVASPAFDFSTPPALQFPPVVQQPPFTGGNLGGGSTTTITQPPQQQNQQTLALQPVGVVGIPFGLVALLLAAGLIGASRLRLFADGVIAGRPVARCPTEEQDQ